LSAIATLPTETAAPSKSHRRLYAVVVFCLLLAFVVELVVPAWRQSAASDEGCHILAGYSYWTRGDFGVNPEHPPAVKLLAGLPLLGKSLNYPAFTAIPFFKVACFVGGREFMYSNTVAVKKILFETRLAVAVLSVLAALLTFGVAFEMFGRAAGLLALVLFVFEPNLIAHGSLVTTDMGLTLFVLATVYAFYRYVKQPSLARLMVTGIAAGLALATKHSGVLLLPILLLLAVTEIFLPERGSKLHQGGRDKTALRLTGSLLVVGLLAVAILWSFYGFRFAARPQGQGMAPSLGEYLQLMQKPAAETMLSTLARYRLLPESYIYGFADVLATSRYVMSYLFGKVYLHGQWFYFPAAFSIKSTLGFLLLLVLLPVAVALEHRGKGREFLFLLIPAVVYFAAAMRSELNLGVRHILPVYPFLIVLAAFTASRLGSHRKVWRYMTAALVLFHVMSSVRAFPNYLPYANELWGGSAHIYEMLSDSNVDWGQQLEQTREYLDKQDIKDCWFDYFGRSVADPAYYHIPCRPLPQALAFDSGTEHIPEHISGTVLISATELSGVLWGPGELNPYERFRELHPDGLIANGILVFRGEFDVPRVAAVSHVRMVDALLRGNAPGDSQLSQALDEAESAVSLAPNAVGSYAALGDAMMRLNRKDEARAAYQKALELARTNYPEFQSEWIPLLEQKLR
jgi:tetratricopeptide (TPR) repeat protein